MTLRIPDKVYSLLNLRKGEERIVGLLFVFSFFQYFAVALFFVTASAIFLTEHPIKDLPYVYIASAATLMIIGGLLSFLEKKFPAHKLILVETILIVLVTLLMRFGFITEQVSWLGYALIVWHRVMSDFASDAFNRLALLLFDVRQGKRLFGLISSSEIPANILGYSTASLLVPFVGAADLLWIAAAGFLVSFVFLYLIVSDKNNLIQEDRREEEQDDTSRAGEGVIQRIFPSNFIFSLGIAVFFSSIAFTLIEFAFLSDVDTSYSSQAEIVRFMAIIFAIGQGIAFLVKTFLYEWVQRRYGIKVSLTILPFVLGLIAVATLAEGIFFNSQFLLLWTWVAIMLITETFRSSLYNTTFVSMLQPLSKKMKLKGYDVLGEVENLAIGLSGVVLALILAAKEAGLLDYTFMLLIPIVGWAAFIPRLNKSYLSTLEDVLKKRIIEGGELQLNNPQTLHIVNEKLKSDHPGEILYALDVLSKEKNLLTTDLLSSLLTHPLPEVRKEVFRRIEALKVTELQELVRQRIEVETNPEIKKMAIHAYCALGEAAVVDEITPLLDSKSEEIQTGALVGLICFGGINGVIVAGQRLMEYVNSQDPHLRSFAAEVIGEVGIRNFYHPLLVLLRDVKVEVAKEALKAAGRIKHPKLYAPMLKAVGSPHVFEVAVNSLIKTGEDVLSSIEPELDRHENRTSYVRRLVYVAGRLGGQRSVNLLKERIYYPNIEIRNQVLHSCALAGYNPSEKDKEFIIKTIHKELADATYILNCTDVLAQTNKWLLHKSLQLLVRSMRIELTYIKKRILFLLAFYYHSREILQLWNNLEMKNREKAANALEILDVIAAKELTAVVLPLLEDYPIQQQLKILNSRYSAKRLSFEEYLQRIITGDDCPVLLPWTQAVGAYVANEVNLPNLIAALRKAETKKDFLISETATWTIHNLASVNPEALPMVTREENDYKLPLIHYPMSTKLLTIEKVMALKTTGLFRETAEDLLVDIAFILKEVPYKKDEVIVRKGEVGTCMFIIYSGSVKVHDGEHLLANLHSREFFGELSLLDAEPRSASVTAMEDSLLLRIDQNAFYEILGDRLEVIREIMKVLCSRLRNQNQEVTRLNEQLAMAEKA